MRQQDARSIALRELSVLLGGLAAFSDFGRDLLLACDTRRLERLATTRFRNDAFVLHTAGETAQHRLEALTLSVLYLNQLKSFLLSCTRNDPSKSGFIYRNDGNTCELAVTNFDVPFEDFQSAS